jgi:hypothetical protein
VKKVSPLVNGAVMYLRDAPSDFHAALRTQLAPRKRALGASNSPILSPGEFRLVNTNTVREYRKGGEPKVDSDHICGVRWNQGSVRQFELNDEADEPAACGIAFEGGALSAPADWLGLANSYPPQLWNANFAINDSDMLRDAEARSIGFLGFEARESTPLLEEIQERTVEISQSLLKEL